MIGRDMAGCLPVVMLGVMVAMPSFIIQSVHGRGLWYCFGASMLTGIIGVCLLVYARLPLYRQRKFLSVGPGEVPAERLPAYRWAWRLIVVTMCIQALLLMKTR